MKKLVVFCLMTLLMAGFILPLAASADTILIEDFESYESDAKLKAAWKHEAGDPMPITIENTAAESGKGVKVSYPGQNLCFANLRMKKVTQIPSNATGIEVWMKNDGEPFVGGLLFRGEGSQTDYYVKATVPTTKGQFVLFKFADVEDGKNQKPTAFIDTAIEDIGITYAMGFQLTFDNFSPKTFYIDTVRVVTDGSAPETPAVTDPSSEAEESSEAPVSEESKIETSQQQSSEAANTPANDNTVLVVIIVVLAAVIVIGAAVVITVVVMKKKK